MKPHLVAPTRTTSDARSGRPPFILVTGGKGGVGKTTLAANLGVCMNQEGLAPLLVDLDFGLANLNVILGIEPHRTVEDFIDGGAPLADCVQEGPGGVRVLLASSGSYRMGRGDSQRSRDLISDLATSDLGQRLILGDSAAGIGGDVLEYGAAATRVLLVTTPEPAAVTDAYGVIKALDSYAVERGVEVATPEVFVNFANDAREARGVAASLRAVCERFLSRSPRFVGWLPRTRSILMSVIEKQPFVLTHPRSFAARKMYALARRYAGLAAPEVVLERAERDVR